MGHRWEHITQAEKLIRNVTEAGCFQKMTLPLMIMIGYRIFKYISIKGKSGLIQKQYLHKFTLILKLSVKQLWEVTFYQPIQ
jgi:hypothetical protein